MTRGERHWVIPVPLLFAPVARRKNPKKVIARGTGWCTVTALPLMAAQNQKPSNHIT
jgi:hypothetical protein